MLIPKSQWIKYKNKLAAISQKAADEMEQFISGNLEMDSDELIGLAYALEEWYGDAAAALACEMYDAVAEAQKAGVPPAEPAEPSTYQEVGKAVNGARKRSDAMVPDTVGRLVKQRAADTTLKNAQRDGAFFAWVPQGDTCPYCMALAGIGWQRAGKKTLKGNHAEHIHANCDCAFVVDFKGNLKVEGYDPDEYDRKIRELTKDGQDGEYGADDLIRAAGHNAKGSSYDVINQMRRKQYAADPEKYRAQKRAAYERARRINYGSRSDIGTDRGVISARRVDKYGYNNIYVDENVTLTERQLRSINKQVSEAKQLSELFYKCDATIVVADMDNPIAAYNPRTNTMLISKRMVSDEEIKRAQRGFACPDDSRSTAVHELFHWVDADEYRKTVGEITDASKTSNYSIYQREKARKKLEEAGINVSDYTVLKSISDYSVDKALENDFEEVYTEYRTQVALNGGAKR